MPPACLWRAPFTPTSDTVGSCVSCDAPASGWSIDWTLADNTVATLSAVELLAVGEALGDQISAAHACGRTLRTQLDAAASVAEINYITWPTP